MEKLLKGLHHLRVIHSLKWTLKMLMLLSAGAGVLVTTAFLVFTFLLLPRLDHYRPALEHQLSLATGRAVTIGRLSGAWDGVAPRLELRGLAIANPGGSALTLDQVTIKPSWLSLVMFEPRLALIELKAPSLDIRRGRDGQLYFNGFPISASGGNGNMGNWLLLQTRISVTDARIAWQDEYLGLPRLTLDQGQLELAHGWFGHTLALSGRPPASVGNRVELSASWSGDDTRDWNTWNGNLGIVLQGARVSTLGQYLQSFGLLRAGEGDGSLDVAFADGQITRLLADIKVTNAAYALSGAGELSVPMLGGQLSLVKKADGYRIDATHLTLISASGPVFSDSNIGGNWNTGGGGNLRVDNVDLAHLGPFLHAFGVDRNPLLANFSPAGRLQDLTLSWAGRIESPTQYRIETGFDSLAWKPFGQVPGVDGVAGSLRFDQTGGHLELNQARTITLPHVFPKPLAFTSLSAIVDWHASAQDIDVEFNQMKFANHDLKGWLSGSYRHHGAGAGVIDLRAGVDQVDAKRVVDYLPYQAGGDTLRWLSQALRGGTLDNTQLQLSGDLDRFPFRKGQGGEFLVAGTVHQGQLLYDKAWPVLTDIDASLQFHNERMDIVSSRASTMGMPLSQVNVSIPDLATNNPELLVNGKVAGALADMLRYTTKSPVDGWLDGLTGKARANGMAALDLGLVIPLSGGGAVRVNGLLHFSNNRLELTSLPIPPLESVNGVLGFNEHGVVTRGVRFKAFGGPFTLTADTGADSRMRFALDGQADSTQVLGAYVPLLAPNVSGMSHYVARFALHDGLESVQVGSDMVGTTLNAPPPLGKAAGVALPLNLTVLPTGPAIDSGLRVDVSLGSQIAARARLGAHGALQAVVVSVGGSLGALPPEGVLIRLALPSLDLQTWANWGNGASTPAMPGLPLRVELVSPDLSWGSYHLSNARVWLGHMPADASWHAMVDAEQARGEIDYLPQGNGMVRARLPLLVLNPGAYSSLSGAELGKMKIRALPALDIRVGNLVYHGNSLGSLDIGARYIDEDWILDDVRLKVPEGAFNGALRVMGGGSVQARFTVDTTDVGKLLQRAGYKDTFRKGQGRLNGELAWPGGLSDFDPARLSGQIQVDLSNGRFAQVNPGVARLLGAISLQSLSRRIRLDFTDVFSQGFSFDTLKGDARISQGIFKSDNVEMKGPGADVRIRGDVNLATETQQLRVHVVPHLAEGFALATGAALINPVAGVAALAAQKILQDPMGKIFSVDYGITGSLTEPVVTKLNEPVSDTFKKIRP